MIHIDPALIAPDPVPAQSSPIGGSGGEAAEGGRPKAGAPADARALIEGQLVMLTRLAQVGMEIAEACGREAASAPIEAGLAFARVARAVRMTIALQSRLAKDLAALDRAEKARTTKRRIRLSRLVEEAVEAQVATRREAGHQYWADEDAVEDEIEQLSSEAYERLIDAEDDDISGSTLNEAMAGICKDLGLSPDWTARLMAAASPPPDASPPPSWGRWPPKGVGGGEVGRRAAPDPEPPPPFNAYAPPAAPPRAPP